MGTENLLEGTLESMEGGAGGWGGGGGLGGHLWGLTKF